MQENLYDGSLKRCCVHLGDADKQAIARIKSRLELHSSALAIRTAIRDLARRLEQGATENTAAGIEHNES